MFALILYGNLSKETARPTGSRLGMMTERIPDSDNSPNVEDHRDGEEEAPAPRRPQHAASSSNPSERWYPYTGNGNHTLPLDFSIRNPPWQYWHAEEPPPEPAPAQGFKGRSWSDRHGWCPPERNECWIDEN